MYRGNIRLEGAERFAKSCTVNLKYPHGTNSDWVCGMQTGTYWLAYKMSGNNKFRDIAQKQLRTYKERFEQRIGMDNHDVGFVYMPSCVAAYKITGDENARKLALDVAEYYYNTS